MESIEGYIQAFPEKVQDILKQIWAIIKRQAPDAVESIAYAMPAYKTKGKPLVYFAPHWLLRNPNRTLLICR